MKDGQNNGFLREQVEITESMMEAFTKSAQLYWYWWGPLGEPMIKAIDIWTEAQREALRSLMKS